jgi:hypothetical protein
VAETRIDHVRRPVADAERRSSLLSSAIDEYVDHGWNVSARTEYEALLLKRHLMRRPEELVVYVRDASDVRVGTTHGRGRHVR